jgi:hypothetical protein
MLTSEASTGEAALAGIDPTAVADEYRHRHLFTWSDRRLVVAAAGVLATPKAAPADSFVLHAPLELLARARLLAYVRPGARDAARHRIVALAAAYAAAGESVDPPEPADLPTLDALAAALIAALRAGELDDVDRYAATLATRANPFELRRLLAPAVVSSLAAAGHASILFSQLQRVDRALLDTTALVRGPARELARYPDWQLRWFDAPDEPAVPRGLADALLDVPMLGIPGSDFIFPVMHQAEESGIASRLLSGVLATDVNLGVAQRQLGRVAALSMLQEPADHAPYGWSHCLTMPQAVLAVAAESGDAVERQRALAVAATYVVGFRAAMGQTDLDPDWAPAPPRYPDLVEALAIGPRDAAAMVWHAPTPKLDDIVMELATRAALHHDAHLVKYTLACFDAAADDPGARRLHLAAASYLSAWWSHQAE